MTGSLIRYDEFLNWDLVLIYGIFSPFSLLGNYWTEEVDFNLGNLSPILPKSILIILVLLLWVSVSYLVFSVVISKFELWVTAILLSTDALMVWLIISSGSCCYDFSYFDSICSDCYFGDGLFSLLLTLLLLVKFL